MELKKYFLMILVDNWFVILLILLLLFLIIKFKLKSFLAFLLIALISIGYIKYQIYKLERESDPSKYVKEGESFILDGEIAFRKGEVPIEFRRLSIDSLGDMNHYDSIINQSNLINIFTGIETNTGTWNIVYVDSSIYSEFRYFTLDSLVNIQSKILVSIEAIKLKDNEWEGKKLLKKRLAKGSTSIVLCDSFC